MNLNGTNVEILMVKGFSKQEAELLMTILFLVEPHYVNHAAIATMCSIYVDTKKDIDKKEAMQAALHQAGFAYRDLSFEDTFGIVSKFWVENNPKFLDTVHFPPKISDQS